MELHGGQNGDDVERGEAEKLGVGSEGCGLQTFEIDMEEEFLNLGLDIIGLGVFNYDFGSITTESPVIKVHPLALFLLPCVLLSPEKQQPSDLY